jgi:hypothetical protein
VTFPPFHRTFRPVCALICHAIAALAHLWHGVQMVRAVILTEE